MKTSIRSKLLVLCTFLVFITATGISVTYYILIKQDKQRESQERIRIAFDIILNNSAKRLQTYRRWIEEFLQRENELGLTTYLYNNNPDELSSVRFAMINLAEVGKDFKNIGYVSSIDRLSLYGLDKRLLVLYQRHGETETVGGYVISSTEKDSYLSLDDPSKLSAMMFRENPIADTPLPENISPIPPFHFQPDKL